MFSLKTVKKNLSFKYKRYKHEKNSKALELHKKSKEVIASGDLVAAVKLGPDEDFNEWLAVNTVDFFNHVNLIHSAITDFCTIESCPTMSVGEVEYQWTEDGDSKPIALTASAYIDKVMHWIQNKLDDVTIFPKDISQKFPDNFQDVAKKKILTRLLRIYAHIYFAHYDRVEKLELDKHMNTCFLHFCLFCEEFNLVAKKEIQPLTDTINSLTKNLANYKKK